MADRFNVDTTALPYGSVGGAGARALQTELLRRQQMQEAQQADEERKAQLALQNARLTAQDQRQSRLDALSELIQKGNLASNEEARSANADLHRQTMQKNEADAFKANHRIDAVLTPEDETVMDGNPFLAGLKLVKPGTPAVPAVQTPADEGADAPMVDVAGTEKPAVPDSTTYAGTPEQQDKETERAFMESIANGTTKFDASDPMATLAAWHRAGGKGMPPAGVVVPKPTGAEKVSEMEAEMTGLAAKPNRTPAEDARLTAVQGALSQLYNRKAGPADRRQQITVDTRNTNREDAQLERASAAAYTRVNKDYNDLNFVLSRAGNLAESLANGGGVGDAVAAPDFLSMMAGGFGSGLRMTDTELDRINLSQNKFNQILNQVKAWTSGRPPKLDDTQRADMLRLAQYVAKRETARVDLLQSYATSINHAATPTEVRDLENELKRAQFDVLTRKFNTHAGEGSKGGNTPASSRPLPTHGDYKAVQPKGK